jgi:hypothetical protein
MKQKEIIEVIKDLRDCPEHSTSKWHVDICANKLIEKLETKQLILSGVSKSLVADIRNKLSSPKNLCAMLKDREVEPFIGNDERNQMIDAEIKQTLKSIEYLSNL